MRKSLYPLEFVPLDPIDKRPVPIHFALCMVFDRREVLAAAPVRRAGRRGNASSSSVDAIGFRFRLVSLPVMFTVF